MESEGRSVGGDWNSNNLPRDFPYPPSLPSRVLALFVFVPSAMDSEKRSVGKCVDHK